MQLLTEMQVGKPIPDDKQMSPPRNVRTLLNLSLVVDSSSTLFNSLVSFQANIYDLSSIDSLGFDEL